MDCWRGPVIDDEERYANSSTAPWLHHRCARRS
jgi:hypothetical protein